MGLFLLILLIVAAVVGVWVGHDRYYVSGDEVRYAPSLAHPCGTDDLGRDILIRILYGAHLTLGTGLAVVLLSAAIGVPLGLSSGYFGGRFDAVAMRIMDMLLAFPSILLAMAVMAALGFGLRNMVLAISIVYIPKFARLVRASAMVEKSLDYVRAAEAVGCGKIRILFRHLLPNCFAPVIVLGTLSLATAILEAAALSFLQLGAEPPLPEWGRMLTDARHAFHTHPYMMFFPGLAISVAVLAVNLVGDGLRDALDVRLDR